MTADQAVLEFDLRCLADWQDALAKNPALADDRAVEQTRAAATAGLVEPLTGRIFQDHEVAWNPENYRESGLAGGLISRHRATLYAIEKCVQGLSKYETKIYSAEALTEFALLLRSHFPKFIGSEYAVNEHVSRWLYPIPHEDLTALSFPDEAFDLVTTNEVLEHVPSIDAALREIKRVLKPGGWHIGTCPFLFNQDTSIRKARLDGSGNVIHLVAPEYHGNPLSPEGSLVFELPGWDILDRARSAGFSDAFCKFVQSPMHGIFSNHCGGVFVLCLRSSGKN